MTDVANTDLWKLVEKTDPSAVKPITGKPYNGNSPKPHWLFYRATELFGPCGIGWGVRIVSERVEPGADGDKVHIAHVAIWYEYKGKRGEVEHVGQTMFSGHRKPKNGQPGEPYTDEDAPKKSVTDATVKALSMIGFAGDIFSGRWDDSKYVAEVREEFAEKRATADRPAPSPKNVTDYLAEARRQLATIGDRDELVAWWRNQSMPMEMLGIKQGDQAWSGLRDDWMQRGKAVAGDRNTIDRTAA